MDNINYSNFIGQKIAGCELVKIIGSGSIGVVFFAEDRDNYLTRAIKLVPKEKITARENWEQEIKKANLIQSVGDVVQYITHGYKTFEGNEYLFIVWQYIDGESLKTVIDNGDISLQILIDVIEVSLNIFEACSQHNIQHSDFHSGNIIVEYPNKYGLDKITRKIWITDFGYGTFSDTKPPMDDYKGLARIIQDVIDKIIFYPLGDEDKIKYSALKSEFPKFLHENNHLEGDYVRNPSVLWEKLNKLFVTHKNNNTHEKSVGDYLAAEFLGDRFDEWESLFVPKFLGADELLDRNICVLTGLRGCGKTMMFKRLSTQLVSRLGPAGIGKENSFVCFYLNARNIAEAFPWLPETEEEIARSQVINYFHLKWTIEILQWLKNEIIRNNQKIRDIGWLMTFFVNVFCEPNLYLTSESPRGIIDNIISKCNEEIALSKLTKGYDPSVKWAFSSLDYLEVFFDIIIKNTSFSKNKSFYMLLDDYSTPLVTESTQRILNSVIFRRCSEVFFKVSTESTESLLRTGLNGKMLEEGADFKLVELGSITINCNNRIKQDTITAIFEKRISRHKLFMDKEINLKKILGEDDLSEIDRALKIRENDRQTIYYGFDIFCDMWSSDLRELIKIFSEMISEEGEINLKKNIDLSDSPIISKKIQDKIFRQAGGRFLSALTIATNPFIRRHASTGSAKEQHYGKRLYDIATAFQEISYFALKYKTSKNQESKPPKLARKIEMTTAIDKLSNESSELYRGLLRYGVFIRDYRGKSVRGTAAVRLYLRSLLIPYSRLTFSKRDNISFEWEDLNDFLENPESFKKKCIKRIEKQIKKDEFEKQSKESPLFPDSLEEKDYVTTDDI